MLQKNHGFLVKLEAEIGWLLLRRGDFSPWALPGPAHPRSDRPIEIL